MTPRVPVSQRFSNVALSKRVEITGRYSVHSFFEHRTHYSFGIGELRVRRYLAGPLVTGLVGFFMRYSYLRITIEAEGKKVCQFRFFHVLFCFVLPRSFPRPVFHDHDRFLLICDSTQNLRLRNYREHTNIRELFDDASRKYSYLVPLYFLFFLSLHKSARYINTRVYANRTSDVAFSEVNSKNLV